jgi:uncharacterized membrane protein
MHPITFEHRRTFLISRTLSVLWSFPVVSFTLTLITDITYWRTMHLMWAEASSWLLFAGLVVGAIAALVWVIAVLLHAVPVNLGRAGIGLAVLLLGFFNSLIHAGDGWTAVVPWGLTISALTVLLMLASLFAGSRHSAHHVDRRLA